MTQHQESWLEAAQENFGGGFAAALEFTAGYLRRGGIVPLAHQHGLEGYGWGTFAPPVTNLSHIGLSDVEIMSGEKTSAEVAATFIMAGHPDSIRQLMRAVGAMPPARW